MQKAGSFFYEFLMVIFSKPPQTPEQLLSKLKNQGLIIEDDSQAIAYINYVGAYRLKGYWFDYFDSVNCKFNPGVSFESIIRRYEFDKELKCILFKSIERVEIAVRSAMANYLSLKHGPHWFLNHNIFKRSENWGIGSIIKKIEDDVNRSRSKFIIHYKNKYEQPSLPPSWAISECVTFNFWSKSYKVLANPIDQKAISMKFKITEPDVFASWLHSLSYLRNILAHHGKIIGLEFPFKPSGYKKIGLNLSGTPKIYPYATITNHLISQTILPNCLKSDLILLFQQFSEIDTFKEIGFMNGWESNIGWKK